MSFAAGCICRQIAQDQAAVKADSTAGQALLPEQPRACSCRSYGELVKQSLLWL